MLYFFEKFTKIDLIVFKKNDILEIYNKKGGNLKMKKIISIISLIMLSLLVFSGNVFAAPLNSVTVNTDKTTVRPGEEVKVSIDFGQQLGAYTVSVAYDNKIFDYVSAEGGTPNDTSDKVKVVFYDSSGGTSPSQTMSVTFRAKADLETSNPTEFSITAEGLANPDASVTYDDITTPIVKNVTVEPQYEDYKIELTYSGNIVKEEEKEMKLSYSSSMGRFYEHARLVAEVTKTAGGTVQVIGTDNSQLEHDIIQSGWGDAQGYKIGGKDVSQVLNVRAKFGEVGDYSITLKLIDRDNSDSVITQETFNFTVLDNTTITPPAEEPTTPEETPNVQEPSTTEEITKTEETPTTLPKTGTNIYAQIVITLIVLVSLCLIIRQRNKK